MALLTNITTPQIRAAFADYFLPLFSPSTSIVAIAAAPALADKISTAFETFGYEVERRELVGAPGEEGESEGEHEDGSSEGDEESGSEEGSESGSEKSS